MCTDRSLTVCRSRLPGGCLLLGGVCFPGGCLLPGGGVCFLGGVCFPGGCLLPGGFCSRGGCLLLWGVCYRGCLLPGQCLLGGCLLPGASAPGGCLLLGVSAPGGVWYPSMHWGRHPPVNRMTNSCKNITLATTSLQPVKMYFLTRRPSIRMHTDRRSGPHYWGGRV